QGQGSGYFFLSAIDFPDCSGIVAFYFQADTGVDKIDIQYCGNDTRYHPPIVIDTFPTGDDQIVFPLPYHFGQLLCYKKSIRRFRIDPDGFIRTYCKGLSYGRFRLWPAHSSYMDRSTLFFLEPHGTGKPKLVVGIDYELYARTIKLGVVRGKIYLGGSVRYVADTN